MELSKKIVNNIPLDYLWADKEILDIKREKYLGQIDIQTLLKNGPVQFVIANLGDKLNWLSIQDCYTFYKANLRDHIINNADPIDLGSLKDNFGYLASLWTSMSDDPIILLEMFH